jgi:hypothetical protein
MRGRSVRDVLALPVRLHGIQLGRPVEGLVDPQVDRLLGFEVVCGDEAQRFLPFSVVELRDDEIALESALTLIDERDLDYYRRRSRRLSELDLADAWLDERGVIHEA